ncbi:hypothetical protein LAV84_18505 [Rhizobium sp. VS19-DR104.2]|uniref:hypothetical protein n=1 Tax=unclassified Rhizobium TaxID=2613769 RepID=UPI001CC3D4B7|nr:MULTISPECIES: hypothetical protein [unclassified Rhizobium]MBZ5761541.1 hypothetical protein [Rhizobium sp. VS19-DR96]MBZ5767489.1 hypothetical protein [Rhizobium sp. VS19-DR129.2]MBZ5775062.1 hypothetical protein [Rhizobium sp. VS19-DRK62.2]MBZ5785973.1 hypothetical protein [Rhizobium sp. VS19-DR121]MBZ5803399.1 hypothetical protein [Rhizobium sp. VS19-DR181]
MPAPSSRQNPQIAVDEFNARYPVGVSVSVKLDNGETKETKTRDKAGVLGGHSAVIWLDGITGCYLLDRVTVRPTPALRTNIKNGLPQKPGYYWAKWRIASDATDDDLSDTLPSDHWEIVEVNDNISTWASLTDEQNPERLSVAVFGVTATQWRDCFVWGEFISDLKPKLPKTGVAA